MNRIDLTYRLRQLGMKKPEFAARLGLNPETVYQWGEVPQYAVAVLELLEERGMLMEKLVEVLGSVATLKETIAGLKRQTAAVGQFKKAPSNFNDDVPIGKRKK